MFKDISREITPLTQSDCFVIFFREKSDFDFPLHNHEEMELNLIIDAPGAQRVVGDHMSEIGDFELVLVGPNLPHAWFTHKCKSKSIKEVTIQFHKDLLDDRFLRRNQLSFIRTLFDNAKKGVLFSAEATQRIAPKIFELNQEGGFNSIMQLFAILHELSVSSGIKTLSNSTFVKEEYSYNNNRIEKVYEYMNNNFDKPITLSQVAKIANMPDASFSRLIKKHTGYTFVDSLNEIRLGHVSRMLIDTTQSVSEIAYHCGFNNMANFNRTFKAKKGCTPNEFRKNYLVDRFFI